MIEQKRKDEIKHYLKQTGIYDVKINRKLEEIQRLEELRLKITTTMKPDVVSNSGTQDKLGDATAKILDLKAEAHQYIDEIATKKREIEAVIDQVEDKQQLDVLKKRYILDEPWSQIASEIKCGTRHTKRIHNEAIEAVDRILKKQKIFENVTQCPLNVTPDP